MRWSPQGHFLIVGDGCEHLVCHTVVHNAHRKDMDVGMAGVRHPKAEVVAHMEPRVAADTVGMDTGKAAQHKHMMGIGDMPIPSPLPVPAAPSHTFALVTKNY
jgi:hypothetical protein